MCVRRSPDPRTASGRRCRLPNSCTRPPTLVANVPVGVRKDLYFTVRVLTLPGVARLLLRQPEPMRQWARWYQQSLRNTEKLYRAGVPLIFGTDTPFAFGNFFHTVMNEGPGPEAGGVAE